MKKVILIVALLAISFAGISQVTGKYVTGQYVYSNETTAQRVYSSVAYPIEVGGENYDWQITASWKAITGATTQRWSKLTTSVIRVQTSPDGATWMNLGACDTMKKSTYFVYSGTSAVPKWMRLSLTVTAGDTIYGLKAWYDFKRK